MAGTGEERRSGSIASFNGVVVNVVAFRRAGVVAINAAAAGFIIDSAAMFFTHCRYGFLTVIWPNFLLFLSLNRPIAWCCALIAAIIAAGSALFSADCCAAAAARRA